MWPGPPVGHRGASTRPTGTGSGSRSLGGYPSVIHPLPLVGALLRFVSILSRLSFLLE